jgi:hypothetical protein
MNYLQDIKRWADEKWSEFGLEFLQQAGRDRDWISNFDAKKNTMHIFPT